MADQLSARVYHEVLDRLLSGQLKPGQVFNRRQLAAELGVSVAPVLEAILELQAEGLIETLPRKGTRARSLSLEDLQGQLIVREALECQAARLYCGAPIIRHRQRLTPLARHIDEGGIRSVERLKEEVRFHHELVLLAECPALTQAYERVMKVGLLYAIQVLHPNEEAEVRHSHLELLASLTTTDAEQAEAVIRAHVQSGKEMLFANWADGDGADEKSTVPAWLRR